MGFMETTAAAAVAPAVDALQVLAASANLEYASQQGHAPRPALRTRTPAWVTCATRRPASAARWPESECLRFDVLHIQINSLVVGPLVLLRK
jgi:hypothetical protein